MRIAGGFSRPYSVRGRSSIADLFKPDERCGLYVLHFSSGNIYAGQALDVTRRYVQHRKVHADIEQISFRRLPKNRLNEEERTLIWSLENNGYRLRNITFTSVPKGESDFDLVMSPEEQNKWLENPSYIDFDGSRIVDPELRRKYSRKYESFANLPCSDEVIDVLRDYVQVGILAFLHSEVSFWCVSCSPASHVYARINIFWQEVLTVYASEDEFWVSLHMADSPLTQLSDEALAWLFERHSLLGITDHKYRPGGPDQVSLVSPLAGAQTFIYDPEVLPAIRLFNLRLMKKGPCNFARYHCMDLADKLVDV